MSNVHIIGICGRGMSAVAVLLAQAGYHVTGSDAGFFDPVASYLDRHGQKFFTSYAASNIPANTDTVIIGKHAKLTPESNPEVAEAFARKQAGELVIMSFPELLSRFLEEKNNLVIVGSYGKSTCTALSAHILREAKRDPSYFIGAFPKGFDSIAHLGKGEEFVLEGDEYPSANFDNRSKFLWYQPSHILFTSGEHDHVNVFPTLADYLKPYQDLFALLPGQGKIIACLDNPHTVGVAEDSDREVITYGLDSAADYHAKNITYAARTTFTIMQRGATLGEFETTELGRHAIQNIVGVVAFLLESTDISLLDLQRGVSSFQGVGGRLEQTNSKSASVPVFEAMGSSYAKARAAIEALLLHYPDKKITAIFEPHTFSWRDPKMAHWYDDVFAGVSELYILMPPKAHGKDLAGQITGKEMERRIAANKDHPVTAVYSDPDLLLQKITNQDRPSGIILLITSSNLSGLTQTIPKLFS